MNKKTELKPEKKTSKPAQVSIDGKDYDVAWGCSALIEAERLLGCNLLQAVQNLSDLSLVQLTGLLYAGIKAANPASMIRMSDVSAMIRVDTIVPILDGLATAYVASMPQRELQPKAVSEVA